VGVEVAVDVLVNVRVGVPVFVLVLVMVTVGVLVRVPVEVRVGVLVGVLVTVPLGLLVAVGVGGHPACTVIEAVMFGWSVQWYANVPRVVKVYEKLCPFVSGPLSHSDPPALLSIRGGTGVPSVLVCVALPMFVHRIVVPTWIK
jgi:hypothetical protein